MENFIKEDEILVVCDNGSEIDDHVLQIISKAKLLANASSKQVSVLFSGVRQEEAFSLMNRYGADEIIFSECSNPLELWDYCELVSDVIKMYTPKLVLFLATEFGKNVAAIMSTRFESGLTADCIDIRYEEEQFHFLRAAINDSVVARIQCINCDIEMATVKKGVFVKQELKVCGECKVIEYKTNVSGELVKRKEVVIDSSDVEHHESIDISQFKTVFCIGRGASQEGNVALIYELAQCCGACVVGTRAVVEESILDKEVQVGQSGKSISPKIYVAFGVSGASQHIVGIKNAELVIAVNHDRKAPIFEYADYAIVEDVSSVLKKMKAMMEKDE
ncbi:MAG: electron transfer flavoprotein subunit alpha/FixB family protein [Clostridium sp.]|nr:electron transfer flavoprotein subunit alpha/FixB family protein [Clostridium sp.]